MISVYDVPADKLISKVAEKLKEVEGVKPPEWMEFAKSGAHRERPPEQENFWYIRCASILRKLYIKSPVGVNRLRREYGGRKHRGVKPEKFRKGSGSIVREALHQLEKVGFVEHSKKGRALTGKGRAFLDATALEVSKVS
ncbi:MAG: 30S ribosomal protein S19e [Candidatus Micrarchaeia archaeon]